VPDPSHPRGPRASASSWAAAEARFEALSPEERTRQAESGIPIEVAIGLTTAADAFRRVYERIRSRPGFLARLSFLSEEEWAAVSDPATPDQDAEKLFFERALAFTDAKIAESRARRARFEPGKNEDEEK
jgi:hypothetical protein